jgi:uncharacterized membrane protein
MTVSNDLERAIAMATAAKGNYLLFATESEDQKATEVFQQMAEDMDRHVTILESRLDYLNQHNSLNKAKEKKAGNGGNSGGGGSGGGGGGATAQQKNGGQGGGQ